MALWIPENKKLPTTIGNIWERALIHTVLIGSTIYYSEFSTEDDGVNRPICQYYTFRATTGEMRFGFRGSVALSPLYVVGEAQNKAFWEYAQQRSSPEIPVDFFINV